MALEQKRLAQAQTHLKNETKAKATLEAQLPTAKAATATTQRAQQTAQGAFNAKQTAFNADKTAVDAAVAAKRVPALTRLESAEKALQQAKLAADVAGKKLANDTAALAALTQEKNQLAKALVDQGKAHDDKRKLVAKTQMTLAKSEAQAMMARQKAASSRTALVNLVAGKQDPVLAAYKNATNMVAESQAAKAKASELLKNMQAEVAVLSKATQAAETAAQVAESESQTVQKDSKIRFRKRRCQEEVGCHQAISRCHKSGPDQAGNRKTKAGTEPGCSHRRYAGQGNGRSRQGGKGLGWPGRGNQTGDRYVQSGRSSRPY